MKLGMLLDRARRLPPRSLGVRIEDVVTVTAAGAQRFDNTPRELQIVA